MPNAVGMAGYAFFGDSDSARGRNVLSRMGKRICRDHRTSAAQMFTSHEQVLFDGRFGMVTIVEGIASSADVQAEMIIDPRMAGLGIGQVWSTGPEAQRNLLPCTLAVRNAVQRDALGSVNGVYSVVLYDDVDRTVRIYSDRLGLQPLYYYHDSDLLLFGSTIQSLLEYDQIDRVTSEEVLAQLLYLGFLASDQTYIRKVHRLPSGSVLMCNEREMSISRYWGFEYCDNGQRSSNVADYSEEC